MQTPRWQQEPQVIQLRQPGAAAQGNGFTDRPLASSLFASDQQLEAAEASKRAGGRAGRSASAELGQAAGAGDSHQQPHPVDVSASYDGLPGTGGTILPGQPGFAADERSSQASAGRPERPAQVLATQQVAEGGPARRQPQPDRALPEPRLLADPAAQVEHHLDARSLRTIPSAVNLSQLRLEALINYTAQELRDLSARELADSFIFQAGPGVWRVPCADSRSCAAGPLSRSLACRTRPCHACHRR